MHRNYHGLQSFGGQKQACASTKAANFIPSLRDIGIAYRSWLRSRLRRKSLSSDTGKVCRSLEFLVVRLPVFTKSANGLHRLSLPPAPGVENEPEVKNKGKETPKYREGRAFHCWDCLEEVGCKDVAATGRRFSRVTNSSFRKIRQRPVPNASDQVRTPAIRVSVVDSWRFLADKLGGEQIY